MNNEYYNDAIATAAIEYAYDEKNKHEPYVIGDIETAFLKGAKWYKSFLDKLIIQQNSNNNEE